jgi:hypothetical protein
MDATAAKAINEIIAILESQHDFWPNSQGWAPSNAIIRLERARLDRSLSFAHTLQNYFAPFPKGSADAQQILGLNFASPSSARVAGLRAFELEKDPDFVRAVRAIVQKCRVNVDVATVYC